MVNVIINNSQKEEIMGYYVRIDEHDFTIKKKNFKKAYQACILLNDRDDLKSGGGGAFTLPNGEKMKYGDPRPKDMNYHPMKWFSWMEPNYPEICKTLEDVLSALGFEIFKDKDGNINGLHYDSKIGDEEYFLNAIASFVEKGSFINWIGEDNTFWQNYFDGKKMTTKTGRIVYDKVFDD